MIDLPASSRFVITGPSGWIGRAMLDAIAKRGGGRLGGQVTAFGSQARTMDLAAGERLEVRALDTITPEDVAEAHVIHLAYLTKEKVEQVGETTFFSTNAAIDEALMRAISGAAPASLFVASSGAAAAAEGGIDRHPYGVAKLAQEERFLAWSHSSRVPTIVGRVFNLAGPHINKLRSYAISDFALQAAEESEIRIQSRVPVFRSYLHVEDLCALVLRAGAARIGRPKAIDLCGAEAVEMADVACLVVSQARSSSQIRRETVDFTRSDRYLGDPTHAKILAMQLDLELKPLATQVSDTVRWLQSNGLVGRRSKESLGAG